MGEKGSGTFSFQGKERWHSVLGRPGKRYLTPFPPCYASRLAVDSASHELAVRAIEGGFCACHSWRKTMAETVVLTPPNLLRG